MVIAQINQQLTSTDLLVWIIVDYIDVGWNKSSHEKIVIIHALAPLIIELKHFLCSVLDQEFFTYL